MWITNFPRNSLIHIVVFNYSLKSFQKGYYLLYLEFQTNYLNLKCLFLAFHSNNSSCAYANACQVPGHKNKSIVVSGV